MQDRRLWLWERVGDSSGWVAAIDREWLNCENEFTGTCEVWRQWMDELD